MKRLLKLACFSMLLAAASVAAQVSVLPATAGVLPGGQLQFSAIVTGSSGNIVIWSLSGAGCSGIGCGQISGQGLYLAPAIAPTYPIVIVTATSLADVTQTGSASVYVGTALNAAVSVAPANVSVTVSHQQLFTATVTGATNTAVTWSVAGAGCTGAACGSVSAGGEYTAPATVPNPAVVTVTATSVANPLQSNSAKVTVTPPVAVSISPTAPSVLAGSTQQFTATVTNTTNTAVTWSVSGAGCTGSACGIISSTGLYAAPSATPGPALVSVTATSVADTTKSASASVTILSPVVVTVAPPTAQVVTGQTLQFTATVTHATNTSVNWSVSGAGCSGAACGAVSSTGLYTAPAAVPSPAQVSVTATSVADSSKSSSATVTVLHAVAVSVSPGTAQVPIGKAQQFTASVQGTSNTSVNWSVSGTGCSGAACGTVSSTGFYTAPAQVPSPAQVTVTATSVATPTSSGSAIVTVTPAVIITVSPTTVQVPVASIQQFSATVTNTTNTAVTWSATGSGCTGSACGTVSASGLYTAPGTVPTPAQVTVTATSSEDSTKAASATVTVVPAVTISVSPNPAQVTAGMTQQFTATVTGTTSTAVNWSLSGAGCSGATCGTISSSGLFTAPAAAPNPAQITVTATSSVFLSKTASVSVTILPPVAVSVSPAMAQIVINNVQQFTATVTGTTNAGVTWSISGAGCTAAACGTISSSGLYTAPATAPNPAGITVKATSAADSTKSGTAAVTILPAISVSVSPAMAEVAIGTQQQFTATVAGTSNSAVTWSLSGAGCAGSTCGTITDTGLYTAPDSVPNPALVTVEATSSAYPAKSASASVTIIPPIVIKVSPVTAAIAVGGTQQFHASVTGNNNSAVTWHVSGSGCSGAECGTIASGGLYTAPATVPSPATITITAASQADASQTSTATLTVLASNNTKLAGQYAFLFKGMDGSGVYQAAGSFTADGKGNLSSGLEDVNKTSGPSTNIPFTGSYQVGNDNSGVMTFTSSLGSHTFSFTVDALGAKGTLIEFDDSGIHGSGVFKHQDPSAFSNFGLSGTYVMNLTGSNAAGARIGALGQMFFNEGLISFGLMDVNDGGAGPFTFAPFNGNYSVKSSGRGTMGLNIPGFDGGSFGFAIYVVSSSEYFMVSTNPLSSANPVFSGPAELQSAGYFSSGSMNGPSVFSLSGSNGSSTQVTAGQFVFDGDSFISLTYDQNTGGAVTTGVMLTGAYDIQINGRGTLNLDNSNGYSTTWCFYAFAPNQAFLLDVSTPFVGDGELSPQTTVAPFNNPDAFGTYRFAPGQVVSAATSVQSGVLNFDGGSASGLGGVAGTEDIAQGTTLASSQPMAGKYSISTTLNDGRGTVQLTSPSASNLSLWVVDDTHLVGFSIDPSDTNPTVLHFEQ